MYDRNSVLAISPAGINCIALKKNQCNDVTVAQLKSGQLCGSASVDRKSTFHEYGQNNVKITFYLLFYFNKSNCFLIC